MSGGRSVVDINLVNEVQRQIFHTSEFRIEQVSRPFAYQERGGLIDLLFIIDVDFDQFVGPVLPPAFGRRRRL